MAGAGNAARCRTEERWLLTQVYWRTLYRHFQIKGTSQTWDRPCHATIKPRRSSSGTVLARNACERYHPNTLGVGMVRWGVNNDRQHRGVYMALDSGYSSSFRTSQGHALRRLGVFVGALQSRPQDAPNQSTNGEAPRGGRTLITTEAALKVPAPCRNLSQRRRRLMPTIGLPGTEIPSQCLLP